MLKASIIGNIGNDPDLRTSSSGSPFLRFNVASNYRARTPEGEWQDRTEWVRVTVFGQRAETLSQHLRKGMRVYAEGRLEARPWTDRENQVRAGLEIAATDVEFMSSRSDDEQRATGMGGESARREPTASRPGGDQAARPSDAPPRQEPAAGDDLLNDLPF